MPGSSPRARLQSFKKLDRAGRALDEYEVAGRQPRSCIAAADHSRYAQLARDDGRVRQRRADIGDDGCGAREEQGSADVGLGGHQDLAWP